MLTKDDFPAVTVEERRFLRNFATTDQIVEWAQQYAAKAIAAHTAKVLEDVEPVALMFQHNATGRIAFVDTWQKNNGWATANPRYKEVGALHGASTVAALKAEIEALRKDAARYRHLRGHRGMEHDSFAVHSTLTDDLLWGGDLDHEIDRIAAIAARSGT